MLVEAGLPRGVLNLVNGDPEAMGQEMLDHPALRKISFTGSVRSGKLLMDGASRTVTRLSLELGGNAPVHRPARRRSRAGHRRRGHRASSATTARCASRRSDFSSIAGVADAFADARRAARLRRCASASGLDAETAGWPAHQRPAARSRRGARGRRGAPRAPTVRAGGAAPGESAARILLRAHRARPASRPACRSSTRRSSARSCRSSPFDDLDEAIALANETPYGLAAYVWTNDLARGGQGVRGSRFGMVGVNEWAPHATEAPFGGWKQSGLGHESGAEGLAEYLETKLVAIGGLT